MSEDFLLITTISHARVKYAIPSKVLESYTIEQLIDNNLIKEFSRFHISEDIIHTKSLTTQQLLVEFDTENPDLASWTEEHKSSWLSFWQNDY